MFGVAVRAQLVPSYNPDLLAWGRAHGGAWWALLEWTVQVHSDVGVLNYIHCSAWCPASTVFPCQGDRNYKWVLRLRLPPDRDSWPRPWFYDSIPIHHYGILTTPAGETPPGYRRFIGGG